MKIVENNFLLKLALAIIFLSHSLHGIFTGNDVNDFGNLFLNKIGFAPFGVYISWSVILFQIIGSLLLILDKFITTVSIIFIFILINGIVLVHFQYGWFVVGAGRNGMEFSFLLIMALITIVLPKILKLRTEN